MIFLICFRHSLLPCTCLQTTNFTNLCRQLTNSYKCIKWGEQWSVSAPVCGVEMRATGSLVNFDWTNSWLNPYKPRMIRWKIGSTQSLDQTFIQESTDYKLVINCWVQVYQFMVCKLWCGQIYSMKLTKLADYSINRPRLAAPTLCLIQASDNLYLGPVEALKVWFMKSVAAG